MKIKPRGIVRPDEFLVFHRCLHAYMLVLVVGGVSVRKHIDADATKRMAVDRE